MPNDHNDARFAASEFAAGLPKLAESPEPAATGFRAAMLESQIADLRLRQRALLDALKELVAEHAALRGNDCLTVVTTRRLIQAVEAQS